MKKVIVLILSIFLISTLCFARANRQNVKSKEKEISKIEFLRKIIRLEEEVKNYKNEVINFNKAVANQCNLLAKEFRDLMEEYFIKWNTLRNIKKETDKECEKAKIENDFFTIEKCIETYERLNYENQKEYEVYKKLLDVNAKKFEEFINKTYNIRTELINKGIIINTEFLQLYDEYLKFFQKDKEIKKEIINLESEIKDLSKLSFVKGHDECIHNLEKLREEAMKHFEEITEEITKYRN